MDTKKVRQLITKLDSFYRMAQTGVAIWNSLLLPILIAVFVTHLFNVYAEKKEVSVAVWGMVALIVVIHLLVSILQFKGSHMDTMLIEYQDKSTKFQEVKDDFEELKQAYTQDMNYFTSQSHALRFTSEALSFAVGRVRNMELAGETLDQEDIEKMVHSLLWPLVVLREKLFAFESGVLWNIALYTPQDDGVLAPVWRMHDKRIEVKNRVWAPGFGVVGLSFLHKTIKYYDNIAKSSETIKTSATDSETYKSIIAIPVIPCEDGSSQQNHSPVGVLVITSSDENQFNLDRDAQFLQTHANLMAIFIEKLRTHAEHTSTSTMTQEEEHNE
ncbi:GAF domain-containing protein [Vibrio sp. 665]|uniref:GAF domain-containing protein n=1 Tax=Vibrio TaxID=662 RepID=UPI0029651660|nr:MULTISPECIES: GAF domain-containing protein [unclassified Vibrio]MDW2030153.1 GAF domain-containing protein [Vibrio sp. 399]MDW2034994.1 GAF domain-containing protein [Vibrio sp. 665]MDW2216447.1 GAF domain-containing protein [Vibrio sp. 1982]